ncbi:MAG: hypothetical protein IPJ00_11265, partial [Saprospirales bacterium]|nr:hypothetical protein [Saprospirales bacterium]
MNTRLLNLFGKVKTKKQSDHQRVLEKQWSKRMLEEEETAEIKVVDETTELAAGAMWIETGLMTGGSRNILDLSKSGRLEGVNKFGSVSYFGI